MIDPQLIRQDPELIKTIATQKNIVVDVDLFLSIDADRLRLTKELNELNTERNIAAKEKDIERGKALRASASDKETQLREINETWTTLLQQFPNLPSSDTPVGPGEEGNVILRTVGEPPTFSFPIKDHVELGSALDIIDNERGARVSGARFTYLKGDLVLLQNALHQFALSIILNESTLAEIAQTAGLQVSTKPFTLILPPLMMHTDVMARMARLEPRDERYAIPGDDSYLIGSAEHTLGPIHMDETLTEESLPIRYAAFTPAFRREAGSYGKDTKGIIRVHQFDKFEMESFSTPETSMDEHLFFVAIQEYLVTKLGLAYQVVLKCTGDQGTPDARASDIDTWMPGQGKYRETHTADLMTDYQARRLATRIKRTDGTKVFAHMNDATLVAMGRMLVAILENGQQEDGTVVIPEVLLPWMNGRQVIDHTV